MIQKKSLGQHFLTDKNIARKIVRESGVTIQDEVWEIGPGKGILTECLLEKCKTLTIFEIDRQWIEYLERHFDNSNLNIIHADILAVDLSDYYHGEQIKIVANLPYQITSPLLFKIIDFRKFFLSITVMIQDEVADRLCAVPGNKDYGKLSVKAQLFFNVTKCFTVPAYVFYPPPKVTSAVVQLSPRKESYHIKDQELLWNVIDTVFAHRRKMLRKSLKNMLDDNELEAMKITTNIELTRRPESLSIEEFIALSHQIKEIKGL